MKNTSAQCNVNIRQPVHMVSGPVKRIERLVVELFGEHWSSLRKNATIAMERERFFFSTNERGRIQMAQRYYAPDRVRRLAQASSVDVLRLCAPWLGPFCEYALSWYLTGRELRKEIKKLVRAEYVAVSELSPDPFGRPPDELRSVHPLPDESVLYGDIYEITASGFSEGSYLRLYKSVAKPFGKTERKQTIGGLVRDFLENAKDSGEEEDAWVITFREPADSRVIEMDVSSKR
jgi:hypothetical protein